MANDTSPLPPQDPALWHTVLYAYQVDAIADLIRAVEYTMRDPAFDYLDSYTQFQLKARYKIVIQALGGNTDAA